MTTKARNIDSNARQRWPNVQIQSDRVALDRILIVCQMLSIPNARVSDDVDGENRVRIIIPNEAQNCELVDSTLHWEYVGTRLKEKIGEQRVADWFAVNSEVHGNVPKVEGHDGRIGNGDSANHVGAVREDFVYAGKDFYVADVETREFV